MALTKARLIEDNAIKAVHIDETATGITLADLTVTGALNANSGVSGNITGNVTGDVTGDLTGTVLTAAQPNITSVGTLSSLTVSGDLTVDTNTLYIDATNNRIFVGTTSAFDANAITMSDNGQVFANNFAVANAAGSVGGTSPNLYSPASATLAISTGGSERMRIQSDGRVNIASATNNTVTFDRQLETRGVLISGITGTSTAKLYLHRDDLTINAGDIIGELNYSAADGGSYVGAAITAIAANSWGGSNSPTHLSFQTADTGLNAPTERLRIDANGKVGIGRTPSEFFDIAKSGTPVFRMTDTQSGGKYFLLGVDTNNTFLRTDANMLFQVGSDAPLEKMRIDANGNVIVGSTTANNANAATFRQDGTAHVNNVQLANAAGSVGGTTPSIYSPAGGQLAISLNSVERLRVDGSGNVGIRTDNPEGTLHLNGTTTDVGGELIITSPNNAGSPNNLGALWFGSIEGAGFRSAGIKGEGLQDFNANDTPGSLVFYTTDNNSGTSVERMRIRYDGNIEVGTGNISFINGKGINFGATSGAGATSTLLDDYEEGTWTPTVNEGAISSIEFATYTKIGRLVTLNFWLRGLSDATSTSTIDIGGLPFSYTRVSVGAAFGERWNFDAAACVLEPNFVLRFSSFSETTANYNFMKYSDNLNSGDNDIRATITYETV